MIYLLVTHGSLCSSRNWSVCWLLSEGAGSPVVLSSASDSSGSPSTWRMSSLPSGSVVSDVKSIISVFPTGKVLSHCFQDSVFVFTFRKFHYDVSWCGLLWVHPVCGELLESLSLSFNKSQQFQPRFLWSAFQPHLTPSLLPPGLWGHKCQKSALVPQREGSTLLPGGGADSPLAASATWVGGSSSLLDMAGVLAPQVAQWHEGWCVSHCCCLRAEFQAPHMVSTDTAVPLGVHQG